MFMGILYLFLTYLICFILVIVVKFAVIGIKSLKKPTEPKQEKPEPKPEPVYYIVEKKRAKKTYTDPKEIQFKK